MFNTDNENSINDKYLIEDKSGKLIGISYRRNLVSMFEEIDNDLSLALKDNSVCNIKQLRELVTKVEEKGYKIYQLTRL